MSRLPLALVLALLALPARAQSDASGWVQLADGDVVRGRVAMHARGHALPYLSVDGTRYDLHHLRRFGSAEGTFGVAEHPAIPVPLVVKQVGGGRLELFTTDLGAAGVGGEASSDEMRAAGVLDGLSFVRTEDGAFVPVRYGALRDAIGMHPAARRHLARYRTMGTLTWIGTGAGAGLAAAGVGVWAADAHVGVPAPTIVGGGIALAVVTAFLFPHFQERALLRAVADYNAAVPRR